MSSDTIQLHLMAEKIKNICIRDCIKIVAAESCTGGQIAAALTALPGTSQLFERGFVTYSNESKTEMLGVPKDMIEKHGAVSSEVAIAMAKGALENSHADIAISITGIAGPTGATPQKPVGHVHIAIAMNGKVQTRVYEFGDIGRAMVRDRTAEAALQFTLDVLSADEADSGAAS